MIDGVKVSKYREQFSSTIINEKNPVVDPTFLLLYNFAR